MSTVLHRLWHDHAMPDAPALVPDGSAAWAQARASAEVRPRRPAPRVATEADFRRVHRSNEQAGCLALMLAGFAVVVAGLQRVRGGSVDAPFAVDEWIGYAVAGGLLLAALAVWVWAPLTRERRLREAYAGFRERGVLGEVHRTDLVVDSGDGTTPVVLVIDTAVSDAQASRLHRAVGLWLAQVAAAPDDVRRAARRWVKERHVAPTEELFGPEGAGGYLAVGEDFRGWRILVPGDDCWTTYHLHDWEYADLGDVPEGALGDLRAPRRKASRATVRDRVALVSLLAGSAACFAGWVWWLVEGEVWLEPCGGFAACGNGQLGRMFLMVVGSVMCWVAAVLVPDRVARRDRRWRWALCWVVALVAVNALALWLALAHPIR